MKRLQIEPLSNCHLSHSLPSIFRSFNAKTGHQNRVNERRQIHSCARVAFGWLWGNWLTNHIHFICPMFHYATQNLTLYSCFTESLHHFSLIFFSSGHDLFQDQDFIKTIHLPERQKEMCRLLEEVICFFGFLLLLSLLPSEKSFRLFGTGQFFCIILLNSILLLWNVKFYEIRKGRK